MPSRDEAIKSSAFDAIALRLAGEFDHPLVLRLGVAAEDPGEAVTEIVRQAEADISARRDPPPESWGYRVDDWDTFVAKAAEGVGYPTDSPENLTRALTAGQALLDRARAIREEFGGDVVFWDPDADAEGYLVVGNTREDVTNDWAINVLGEEFD